MADTYRVTVRIDKYLDGDTVRLGVPVRFRPIIAGPNGREARRTDRSREIVTVIAPVTAQQDFGASAYLAAGDYEVEAILPSGEQLSDELSVTDNAQDPEKATRVVLRGESSPNEWRSWGHYAGSALVSTGSANLELAKATLRPSTQLEVSVGSYVLAPGLDRFDPSSWDSWFAYLEKRFRRGPDDAPTLALGGNESELSFDTEGGYGGTPLRVKFVVENHHSSRADLHEIGTKRTYAAISGLAGTRLIALPWPWGEEAHYNGSMPFELLAAEDTDQLRCEFVHKDERWAGLLAYLNRGRVDLASEILNSATDALFGKFQNPLAAAVGGYLLLSSNRRKRDEKWPDWLDNLSRRFPNLPDGPILRARWLLAQNSKENLQEAHDLLVQSVERGLPYFTTGVVWLIEALEQTSISCVACVDILRRVRGVARSMDLSQAFTSFSIAKPLTRSEEQSHPELGTPPGIELEDPFIHELIKRTKGVQAQASLPEPQYVVQTLNREQIARPKPQYLKLTRE